MAKKLKSRKPKGRPDARPVAPELRCGRYQLLSPLGAGGMAEVFKARVSGRSGFQRDVVLKRLLASNKDDAEFVDMFTDEARILGLLHHPNIVQALDFGATGDHLYLVLEYLEGPSLGRVLRERRPVPPALAAFVGREICRALDYLHRAVDETGAPLGLVHRDVTPSNIIVTTAGAVKLLDFGIAKFAKARQSTGAGVVKGKFAYLSPEQLRGAPEIDGRVDLFALGTVLHELCTGERLFTGASDLATMQNILHMKLAPPSRKNPAVPPALDRVVLRALARDRSKRFADAGEMARALDEVVVAAGLRVDEVVRFVRAVETAAPTPALSGAAAHGNDLPTRRDVLLPARLWLGGLGGLLPARRAALVAGLGLALGAAGALGWGLHPHPAGPRPPLASAIATVR
jgi:serine/threonine-protein kinase